MYIFICFYVCHIPKAKLCAEYGIDEARVRRIGEELAAKKEDEAG